MSVAEMTGKIQKNFNITLPKKIREAFRLRMGDFVSFVIVKDKILLEPKKLVDSSQAYFWTKEWQEEELEAESDIKAGRISKTKNAGELIRQLKK